MSAAGARSILVLNAGSSSIKFARFDESRESGEVERVAALSGQIEGIGRDAGGRASTPASAPASAPASTPAPAPPSGPPSGPASALFSARDASGATLAHQPLQLDAETGHREALSHLLDWLERHDGGHTLAAVGHRVVHGGAAYRAPVLVDQSVMTTLAGYTPLAPLHQPHNLAAIEALAKLAPGLPQVACFDTAFHATQAATARAFALPRALTAQGVCRYGFHGLSYEYIADVLPGHLGAAAEGRVVVAHLGNGASMCALEARRSVATTMGFTALDGLVMGTRCGAIDPGVLLYLIEHCGMDGARLTRLLYHESGLLGVSGVSGDMRELLASAAPAAREAIELFCYRIARELGSLAAALGGIDALVFTAGIGEHAAPVRARVCQQAAWLGVELDADANEAGGAGHARCITTATSRVAVWVVPTNEEWIIARHARALIGAGAGA